MGNYPTCLQSTVISFEDHCMKIHFILVEKKYESIWDKLKYSDKTHNITAQQN